MSTAVLLVEVRGNHSGLFGYGTEKTNVYTWSSIQRVTSMITQTERQPHISRGKMTALNTAHSANFFVYEI